jgi:hypothetical protein
MFDGHDLKYHMMNNMQIANCGKMDDKQKEGEEQREGDLVLCEELLGLVVNELAIDEAVDAVVNDFLTLRKWVNNLKVNNLEVNNLKVNNLKVNNLKVNNLKVNNLKVNNLKVNNLEVNNLKVASIGETPQRRYLLHHFSDFGLLNFSDLIGQAGAEE